MNYFQFLNTLPHAVAFFMRTKGAIAPCISKVRSNSMAKFTCGKRSKCRSNILATPFVSSKILKIDEL